MQSLANVLDSLRLEVTSALAARTPLPHGVRLQPKRVVISLGVHVVENATGQSQLYVITLPVRAHDSAGPISAGVVAVPTSSPHTLTIEFDLDPEAAAPAGQIPASTSTVLLQNEASPARTVLDAAAERALVESLAQLLGHPGFDSSARASVFREAMEGLSATEIQQVVQALQHRAPDPLEPAVKRAVHFIGAVLRSGPLRSPEEGGRRLAQLLQAWQPQPLLELLQSRWKSQEDWLEPPATPEAPAAPPGGFED